MFGRSLFDRSAITSSREDSHGPSSTHSARLGPLIGHIASGHKCSAACLTISGFASRRGACNVVACLK